MEKQIALAIQQHDNPKKLEPERFLSPQTIDDHKNPKKILKLKQNAIKVKSETYLKDELKKNI